MLVKHKVLSLLFLLAVLVRKDFVHAVHCWIQRPTASAFAAVGTMDLGWATDRTTSIIALKVAKSLLLGGKAGHRKDDHLGLFGWLVVVVGCGGCGGCGSSVVDFMNQRL